MRPENLGRQVLIQKSYAAREACLLKNAAAENTSMVDAATLAHSVALACSAETEALITASNFDGDKQVANNVRQDTQFRALKYVFRARGQSIF